MSVLTKTERKQRWEGKNRIRPKFVCVIKLALYWVSAFFQFKIGNRRHTEEYVKWPQSFTIVKTSLKKNKELQF